MRVSRWLTIVNFRKEIKIEDRGPIANWLGDSQVWMQTAIDKDKASQRANNHLDTDVHELNVAHVCAGLAFELVLKALAKSEGRQIVTKHEATKCYRALSKQSQEHIATIIQNRTALTFQQFLRYLDDRMCHPDRRYWMVGRKGEARAVGFAVNLKGLVVPDLANVHADIAELVGANTFEDWQPGTQTRTGRGPQIASFHLEQDGSIRPEVTESGRATRYDSPRNSNR